MTKPRPHGYIRAAMKYIISDNGLGIAVGLIGDQQEATEVRTLAENIFGINTNEDIFKGVLYMRDFKQFKKFLVLKEYFRFWSLHFTRDRVAGKMTQPNIMSLTKRAIKQAGLVLESSVQYENFMRQIHQSNVWYNFAPEDSQSPEYEE